MSKKAYRCKNIYTAVTDILVDGYVVTEGNRILFVGNENDSREYIDGDTDVYKRQEFFGYEK